MANFAPMSFFTDIYRRLFGTPSRTGNYQKPFLQETLKRSAAEILAYEQWLESGAMYELQTELYRNYLLENDHRENALDMYVLKNQAASGFYFKVLPPFTRHNIVFFFDALRDKVLEEGYQLYTSHRTTFLKNGKTEVTEMHYLKPAVNSESTTPLNQMYGNIRVDLVSLDGTPQYLKLTASFYSDRNYTEALNFSALMKNICQPWF